MSENITEQTPHIRAAVLGDRVSRKAIAKALDCCTRSVDNLAKRYNIQWVSLLGERYYLLVDFKHALSGAPPRRRGRPPKVAA